MSDILQTAVFRAEGTKIWASMGKYEGHFLLLSVQGHYEVNWCISDFSTTLYLEKG